ncbi:MAG TPA: ATP-grasp domain-containing protein [Planctomycetota bacterium]|nr:ATP-grasp domain-containing protein [Planctomycetota bacterium]
MRTAAATSARPRTLLLVGPTIWDREELRVPSRAADVRTIEVDEPGYHVPETAGIGMIFRRFDVLGHIERVVEVARRARVDGVLGTEEFLSCAVAAVVARRLGLPGPDPGAVLRCQHKYHSRLAQREAAPECVPAFAPIDPRRPDAGRLRFPLYVKPVRGTTSVLTRRVQSPTELREFVAFNFLERAAARRVLRPFHDLLRAFTDLKPDAACFLAEEELTGALVTVEGYAFKGRVEMVGVTDSTMFPGTMSFMRFDYPSKLPREAQARMGEIAVRLVSRLGLDNTLFNVEMFYDARTGRIGVVEVNPRMSYQFADLYEKVDGFNSYDIATALAFGEEPVVKRGAGPYRMAASFVLRRFENSTIARMPSPAEIATLFAEFPDARLRLYGRPGMKIRAPSRLSESFRYGLIHLGGDSPADLERRFDRARAMLTFEFGGSDN